MKTLLFSFMLLCAITCTSAHAQQVYKCKDSNGKTIYSQNPCANLSDPSQTRLSTQTGATSFAGVDSRKDPVAVAEAKAKAEAKTKDDDEKATLKRAEDIKQVDRRANRCAMLGRQGEDFERKLKAGANTSAYEDVKSSHEANRKEQTKERCATVRDEQRLLAADAAKATAPPAPSPAAPTTPPAPQAAAPAKAATKAP